MLGARCRRENHGVTGAPSRRALVPAHFTESVLEVAYGLEHALGQAGRHRVDDVALAHHVDTTR